MRRGREEGAGGSVCLSGVAVNGELVQEWASARYGGRGRSAGMPVRGLGREREGEDGHPDPTRRLTGGTYA
jgi:hypothetical protein